MPLQPNLYRGYLTDNYTAKRTFRVCDVNCVETDLLNHIFTRRGERVMMSNFGTIIPELAFEPMDDATLGLLRSELINVIKYDPRVSLLSLNMQPNYDVGSVSVSITVLYVELNVTGTINLNIEFESA
jgi:phage baseplate assembly protein W